MSTTTWPRNLIVPRLTDVTAPHAMNHPSEGAPIARDQLVRAPATSGHGKMPLGGLLGALYGAKVTPVDLRAHTRELESLIPKSVIGALSAKDRASLHSGQRNLVVSALVKSSGWVKLDAATQRTLLEFQIQHGSFVISSLVDGRGMLEGSPAERAQMVRIFAASDGSAPDVGHGPIERLRSTSSAGRTVLDELETLANRALDPELTAQKIKLRDLVDSTVREVSHPDQNVSQSNHGTCGVTSISYLLARDRPAEYARLVSGLAHGSSIDMANGSPLTRVPDSLSESASKKVDDSIDTRSDSERILQSAMMEFANGSSTYSNVTDSNTRHDIFSTSPSGGANSEGLKDLDTALWNHTFIDEVDADTAIAQLSRDRRASVFSMRGPTGAGHAFAFDHIANGRVYLRNPWGPDGGKECLDLFPGLRHEAPGRGLQSISIDDAKRMFLSAVMPE